MSYQREQTENWVADFCETDALSDVVPEASSTLRAAASYALTELLRSASERTDRELSELTQEDLSRALLESVASLPLKPEVHARIPAICGAFFAHLEAAGRLGGGRALGAYLKALAPSYTEVASGKPKPITNPGSKLGRNDPCPCGSGKKYKKCCSNR